MRIALALLFVLSAALLTCCRSTSMLADEGVGPFMELAHEPPDAEKLGLFMGLADDAEQTAETEDGTEYVATTKVLPGMFDTYEYVERTGQLVAEQRVAGRLYYAVRITEDIPAFFAGDPPQSVEVTLRSRCNIPPASRASWPTCRPTGRTPTSLTPMRPSTPTSRRSVLQ